MLPTIHYQGPNAVKIVLPGLTLYFSYETCVGFERVRWDTDDDGHDVLVREHVVSENVWSRTTGKHLNRWFGDAPRLDHNLFREALEQAVREVSHA